MLKSITIAIACVTLSSAAGAATIVPTGVVALDTFSLFGQYKPENLINGSGLSQGGLHDADFSAMWMTNLGVNQAQITFDLGSVFTLSGVDIWNYNFGDPQQFQSTILRGVKDLRLLTSLDGVAFQEASTGTLQMGTGQPLAGQSFSLTGDARFVKLDILNNYGQGTYAERDWNSGLSEVRFAGVSAVPEPATWAMMLLGFGAVGYSMRRRKVSYGLCKAA